MASRLFLCACLCLVVPGVATLAPAKKRVSFWYAPDSYNGADINVRILSFSRGLMSSQYLVSPHVLVSFIVDGQNTLAKLRQHRDAVTNVFVYCGYGINASGLYFDPSIGALCTDTNLLRDLKAMGITTELVINSGSSDIKDYRAFFAKGKESIAAIESAADALNVAGVSFDLEPQVGSPPSTANDSVVYANFLGDVREVLAKTRRRLTVAVAQWSPMLSDYAALAPNVDRLLDMSTYTANSLSGWLNGDDYGGTANLPPRSHTSATTFSFCV